MPSPPAGVNVAEGLPTALNWPEDVDGPLTTAHVPVPEEGVFAAITALAPTHISWLLPAIEVTPEQSSARVKSFTPVSVVNPFELV